MNILILCCLFLSTIIGLFWFGAEEFCQFVIVDKARMLDPWVEHCLINCGLHRQIVAPFCDVEPTMRE